MNEFREPASAGVFVDVPARRFSLTEEAARRGSPSGQGCRELVRLAFVGGGIGQQFELSLVAVRVPVGQERLA